MKLSDSEKRDIVRLIESGKNIPEKYRFLLFEDSRKVEIFWEDKSLFVPTENIPFQIIENIDEPRTENFKNIQSSFEFASGKKISGWTNKLIWGDNREIIASLNKGPLRSEIEDQGGVKLIYIDPPFSVGQDYSIPIEIPNGDVVNKIPSVVEMFAYRNTWNRQGNSFLQMLYERITIMRELLKEDGVLVLRIDFHWGHYVKCILDEIFGLEKFRNEIIINRVKKNVKKETRKLNLVSGVESLYVYSKSQNFSFFKTSFKLNEKKEGYWRACDSAGARTKVDPSRTLEGQIFFPPKNRHFTFSQEKMNVMYEEGKLRVNQATNKIQYFVEPKDEGDLDTNWTDIPGYSFSTNYPTENSEKLLNRVIELCTEEEDLVCDFFCGSGTTATVAEKLNRKWITTDIGKFSIHTAKKRLINVQRQLKKNQKNWRSFEVLNIGKYQRQFYLGSINSEIQIQKENAFRELILQAYKASSISGFKTIIGQKGDTFVSCGPVNQYVSRNQVEELIQECIKNKIINCDILGFDFEMNLFPSIQEDAKKKGLNLKFKKIPIEIFNKKLISSGKVFFHDVSHIEIKTNIKKNKISIQLVDFATFYDENSSELIASMNNGVSKIIMQSGDLYKISKDREGVIQEELLTPNWSDWVDYWSVDFDYESKPEIIRFPVGEGYEEHWTGSYIFENEWQSFRSKENYNLDFITPEIEVSPGTRQIAIKVIDLFGNDTMKVIEVKI